MRCKKCGTELKDDDEFCYRCGLKTTALQRAFASKMLIGSVVVIFFVAVVAIVTVLVMSGHIKNPFEKKYESLVSVATSAPDATQEPNATNEEKEKAQKKEKKEEKKKATPEPVKEEELGDVTATMKKEVKPIISRVYYFLAYGVQYLKEDKVKFDDNYATAMAIYNLEHVDRKITLSTNFDQAKGGVNREIKRLFGTNAKYKVKFSDKFPNNVYKTDGNRYQFVAQRIPGKDYKKKIISIEAAGDDEYKVRLKAGLVSSTNANDKGLFGEYDVTVKKDETAKFGYVITNIE